MKTEPKKILTLYTSENQKTEPNWEILNAIKNLMDRTCCGELQGLAIITIDKNNKPGIGWWGSVENDPFKTIGYLECLKQDFLDMT